VFERRVENGQIYTFKVSNPKGHARMILGAAWAPSEAGTAFATAGRDKCIKIWKAENNRFVCETTILAVHPVTTVDFHPRLFKDYVILASGTEHGDLTIYTLDRSELVVRGTHTVPPR
jgi:elongator complex protein 2